jgi:hypothetical protein
MIDVKYGVSCDGFGGLIEQPKFEGLDVRVFQILDSGHVVWRNFHEWQSHGERARTYGCNMEAADFSLG